MQLLGRLNLMALVASFAIGIMLTYVIVPTPRVVVKFPSPYNAGRVLYRDKADTCFMYRSDHVECSSADKPGEVLPQPLLLEDFRPKASLGSGEE